MSMLPTLARRSLRARLGRSIFIGLSIMAGVAFVAGSFIVADSFKATFDNLIDGLVGDMDLEVRSELTVDDIDAVRDPIPVELVDAVAAVPGVAVAEGNYARFAQIVDKNGKPVTTQGAPTLGVSWNPESKLSGVNLKEGVAPSGVDNVAIDKATAERVGYEVGERITVVLREGQRQFNLVGLIGLGDSDGFVGATTVVWDPQSARQVLDTAGTVDTVDIRVEDGIDTAAVKDAIEAIIPDRTEVVTGAEVADETKDQVGEIVSIFGTGLLIFALITALVAGFVINNVYGITITQRLRELALLRAVGSRGAQVRRLVVVEALVVSIIATLLGILGGFGVARGIIGVFNAAGAGFPDVGMVFKPRTAIAAAMVGIGVAIVSVLVPAWRASRIPPVAAMRPEAGFAAISRSRGVARGGVLAVIGLAMFVYGLLARPGGGAQWGAIAGLGALATVFGVTILAGTFARPVSRLIGWPIQRLFGTPGKFARDNAGRVPRRTARTASALMIGVAMIAAAAVFTASLRDTFGRILDRAIEADYIVLDNESFQQLPPEIASRLEALPELSAVSPSRTIRGSVPDGASGTATATLTAINPATFAQLVDLDVSEGSYESMVGRDSLMLFRDTAEDRGVGVGDTIPVTWQNGVESELVVAGLFDDNSLDAAWLIPIDTLESVSTQTPSDQFVLAKRAEGVSLDAATESINAALAEFPQAAVQTDAEFREEQEGQINQLLQIVTTLLGVAIAFSFLGIAIALALSVYERTREIGLLRAVGMSRLSLRRSVRLEAVIVAIFGVLVGIALGLVFGITLAYAVPNTVIDGITLPTGTLIFVLAAAIGAAVIAAWYPARKASRMNVLEAIATE